MQEILKTQLKLNFGLATPAAALAATILTTLTTGDPGSPDDGPHHNGSIKVASKTGSSSTFADEDGTPMVKAVGTPTASAAALVSTISTTLTTRDPGSHDDVPHHNGSIEVASTAGSSGTFADEAGTPMVEPIDTPTTSEAAFVLTTTTTGHDDIPHANGAIVVASTAGTTCTIAKDIIGTLPVDATCCITGLTASAAALSLHTTIRTTSGCQWIYNFNNAENAGGETVVPPDFAGDDIGTAGGTQQYATAGDYDGTLDPTTYYAASPATLHACEQAYNDYLSYPPQHRPYHHVDLILAKFCLRKVAVPAHPRMAQATPHNIVNAGNNGRGTRILLPEFAGDDASTNNAGDMQQNAMATGAYDNNNNVEDTLACTAGRPTIEHPILGPDLPSSPEMHPAVHNNSLTTVPPVTMSPTYHPVPSYLGAVLHTIGDGRLTPVLTLSCTLALPSPSVVIHQPLQTGQRAPQVSPSHPLPLMGGISTTACQCTRPRRRTGRRKVPRAPSHLEKVSPHTLYHQWGDHQCHM